MANSTVGVKLDEHTRARLKKLGEAKQRSAHWLMKDAISRYLDTEERYEREKLEDETRWQRYQETGVHLDQDEILSWLDDLAEQAARKADLSELSGFPRPAMTFAASTISSLRRMPEPQSERSAQ